MKLVPATRARDLKRQVDTLQHAFIEENRRLVQTQAQAQAHRLFEFAPIAFISLDRKARIHELNGTAARLLDFPASFLLNRPFLVFVAKHDLQRLLRHLTESARDRELKVFEMDLLVQNRLVPVQISLTTVTAATGEVLAHQMTVIDLVDIKKTESELQESLAQWYSLVQNAPDAIMRVERSGRIAFVNMPLWGHSAATLVGSRIFGYVPATERLKLRKCLDEVFKSETRSQCEILTESNGAPSWFTFAFGPASKTQGHSRSTTTLFVREISDQKRSEEILRASSEQLRDFAARLDAVREEERTRIARELHDELGQALTILRLDLSWVHGKLQASEASVRRKMKTMIAHVDETIDRVRSISAELRPSILDDLGLCAAIEWLASQIQKRVGIRIEVVSNGENTDPLKEAATATFRVVQEALTNVVRHAAATRVRIKLRSKARTLRISVEDNGKGMTHEQIENVKSLGIVGMKERIARAGGAFNIFSEPGKGTRLDIVVPTQND